MHSFLPRRDLFLALLVVFIWGAHFSVIKAGVAQAEPLVALTIRFGLTALVFLPFMQWPGWPRFFKLAEIGLLLGVCHQGLLFLASAELDSASVGVLMQSQIIFSVLMGWVFLGERFRWRTTFGLAISGIGLVVMLGVPDVASSPRGFVMLMISSVILSFSYIRMRQLGHVHPATFLAVINIASFPVAAVVSLFLSPAGSWARLPDADWWILGSVLAYQVFVVTPSHVLWQQLLSRNEVAKVTCFSLLTPPIAIAIAAVFTGTAITLPLVIGSVLIMAGLGVVVIRRVQKHRNAPLTIVE